MAGGRGTRLAPITNGVNKHLLPVFNKPMIYYPLSTLMLAGVREVLIICNSEDKGDFRRLLGDGSQWGLEISLAVQTAPKGIADGFNIAKDFICGHNTALILGDNVFQGVGLGRQLSKYQTLTGAQIFAYRVKDPENYGVVELADDGLVISLEEKPLRPKSDLAITGLYFYDQNVLEYVKDLRPSPRNELEVTDLNRLYLEDSKLAVDLLSRGTTWLDTGTFQALHDASTFVRIIEERQNVKVGDPLEVAKTQGWI
jgi:glucose-1-phosphate thymidylyltransferase